jgi:hypothetical protein
MVVTFAVQFSVVGLCRFTEPAAKVWGVPVAVDVKSEKLAPMESAAMAPTPTTALSNSPLRLVNRFIRMFSFLP